MSVSVVNKRDITTDLSGRFHQWVSSEQSSLYVLATEYIRHYLCPSRPEGLRQIASDEAAHILAISNRLRNQLFPVYPDEFADGKNPTKEVLHCLQEIGDVQHVGNGYWTPTVPHFVTHPDGITFLIGGAPTSYLERHYDVTFRSSCLARIVHDLSVVTTCRDDDDAWQNYSEWFRDPYVDTIEQWTKKLFSWGRKNFQKTPVDDARVEVYNSKAVAKAFQLQRWQLVSDLSFVPDHPMLCRIKGAGPTVYLLADIQEIEGELRIVGEVGLHRRYRTQIMYALDNYDKSNTVCDMSVGETTFSLTLRNYIPEPVRRLFYAFSQNPFYAFDLLPHRFIFHSAFRNMITRALEQCGVQIRC